MFLYVKLFFSWGCRFLLGSKRRLQVGRNQDLKFSLKTRPGQHWSNTLILTGVVPISHFRPNLWIPIQYIFIYKRRKICISKKSDIYYTIWLHIILCIIFFASYEYGDFQFSQNYGYAQRLCISIF
jgi:hypothetical protein